MHMHKWLLYWVCVVCSVLSVCNGSWLCSLFSFIFASFLAAYSRTLIVFSSLLFFSSSFLLSLFDEMWSVTPVYLGWLFVASKVPRGTCLMIRTWFANCRSISHDAGVASLLSWFCFFWLLVATNSCLYPDYCTVQSFFLYRDKICAVKQAHD